MDTCEGRRGGFIGEGLGKEGREEKLTRRKGRKPRKGEIKGKKRCRQECERNKKMIG